MRLKDNYIQALCQEIDLRKNYLSQEDANTLYFGGGTPSCLDLEDLSQIVCKLEDNYCLASSLERTIEMNPEDAEEAKLKGLYQIGFNRLSIGVQAFDDEVLKRINRKHSSAQAIYAIEQAAKCGFENIGIDLIIGLPGYPADRLEKDVLLINRLPVSHISVYMLSIEPRSVFAHSLQNGELLPEDEDVVAETYIEVSDRLKELGFEHYEISNFAKDFKYARHNTSYWQQRKYIGFGAAAHSYNGDSRQWNIPHVKNYIDSLNKGQLSFEKEELTKIDKFNEYIMTSLRTQWGIEIQQIAGLFPEYWAEIQSKLYSYLEKRFMFMKNGYVCLTEKGWLISDRIFSDLFVGGK